MAVTLTIGGGDVDDDQANGDQSELKTRASVNEERVNERMNKKRSKLYQLNKKLLCFLAKSYSAHLSIDVHCSNLAKKFS